MGGIPQERNVNVLLVRSFRPTPTYRIERIVYSYTTRAHVACAYLYTASACTACSNMRTCGRIRVASLARLARRTEWRGRPPPVRRRELTIGEVLLPLGRGGRLPLGGQLIEPAHPVRVGGKREGGRGLSRGGRVYISMGSARWGVCGRWGKQWVCEMVCKMVCKMVCETCVSVRLVCL